MNSFKDLGIKPAERGFTGDKIKMDKVLNREISVLDFRIKESKYPDSGSSQCLHLQIQFSGQQRVLFTGSLMLMEMIQKVPRDKFPFKTTIVRENERFEFT